VVRHIAFHEDQAFVLHSSLDEQNVDAVIDAQIAYFESIKTDVEWKLYDYDKPADLIERLARRGFEVDEPEAVMVIDLETAPSSFFTPSVADIRMLENPVDLVNVAKVEEPVWAQDFSGLIERLQRDVVITPKLLSVYVAFVDGKPASAAWIYFHHGTSFASLWGGSTLPEYRGQGLYSALLAVRAREARARGFGFLTVDASPMSRPILETHGFTLLATARACMWHVRPD
jgi:GNAT superfamily N-acetyltransferase